MIFVKLNAIGQYKQLLFRSYMWKAKINKSRGGNKCHPHLKVAISEMNTIDFVLFAVNVFYLFSL